MSEREYLAWRGERETEITKLFNVRNLRAPIRRVADTRVPLGPGEFYHGTTKQSAKAIRQGGFQLADPRSTKHRGADAMIRGDKTVRNTSTMRGGGPREGQKVRSRTGRPIASGDMGPGVYVTEDPDFAGGMAHTLGSKGKMNPKLLSREGTRLGEVMRVKVRGATASGPNPRGPRQGLKREGGMPFGRMTPKAAKEGYVGVDAGGGLFNGPHQIAVGNPRDVVPVHTPKRWAAGWTPGEYEAAAYGTAGAGSVGLWAHQEHKKDRYRKQARAQAVARSQQRRKVSGRR